MDFTTMTKHMDITILSNITKNGFDEARHILYNTSRRMKDNVTSKGLYEVDLEKISQMETVPKHNNFYIQHAEKRIIDLYKLELRWDMPLSDAKKFKLLLFKEQIENKIKEHNTELSKL